MKILPQENDVEVCCLLEQLKSAKEHIEIPAIICTMRL